MGRRAALRLRIPARSDDGAAAVEFGLLLPLFVMLTLGTISAGFAFHAWLSVTHGAQESSRFAATLSVEASGGTATTWLNQVTDRALAAADVTVSAGGLEPGTSACVSVVSATNVPPLNAHMTVTADDAGTATRSQALTGPCPNLPTMTGDYVQTYVSLPVNFNYMLGSAELVVGSKSVNRFEAVSLS